MADRSNMPLNAALEQFIDQHQDTTLGQTVRALYENDFEYESICELIIPDNNKPCYHCPIRHYNCHSTCRKHQKVKQNKSTMTNNHRVICGYLYAKNIRIARVLNKKAKK